MAEGWQRASIDELEKLPVLEGELTWRPVRRYFGIRSFGVNAYTADEVGRLVVEEHTERGGHEELYFVATGSATFTLDGETVAAPAGTFVHVLAGTKRVAVADEPGTTVLTIGAKEGEVFEPSPWERTFAAYGYLSLGDGPRARTEVLAAVEEHPDVWQSHYHAACIETLAGNTDAGLEHFDRAVELGGEEAVRQASDDRDLDAIRDDPRFPTLDS